MRRVLLLLALCACVSPGPTTPPPTHYDFGLAGPPLPVAAPFPGSLAVADVGAPEWISGEGIIYRLAYQNAARPAAYSRSRWVAPPAALLSQRLRQRLANVAAGGVMQQASGVPHEYVLHVELEEFSQVFDAPQQSRAVVRVRASLIETKGALLAQETFSAERPARPDAVGAAMSLREATDAVIEALAAWLLREVDAARERGPSHTTRE